MNASLQLLIGAVIALAVHEAGHAAMARLLHLPWRVVWKWRGPWYLPWRWRGLAVIVGRDDIDLTRGQVRITNAGGPLFNVLLALVCFELGYGLIVAVNLEFAFWNLILPHSDGSRILRPGRAIRLAREAERA